jgi:hypothetical protein
MASSTAAGRSASSSRSSASDPLRLTAGPGPGQSRGPISRRYRSIPRLPESQNDRTLRATARLHRPKCAQAARYRAGSLPPTEPRRSRRRVGARCRQCGARRRAKDRFGSGCRSGLDAAADEVAAKGVGSDTARASVRRAKTPPASRREGDESPPRRGRTSATAADCPWCPPQLQRPFSRRLHARATAAPNRGARRSGG